MPTEFRSLRPALYIPLFITLLSVPAAHAGTLEPSPEPRDSDERSSQTERETDAEAGDPRGYAGPDWTVRIEPAIAFLAPAGEVRLPSATTRGSKLELDGLNLDSARPSPLGKLIATRGRWRVSLFGLGFSTDDRAVVSTGADQIGGISFNPGDRLVSDLSYETLDLLAGYRFLNRASDLNDDGVPRVEAGLDVLAGLRMHHADFDVRLEPLSPLPAGSIASAEADELFAEPVLGLRGELEFARTLGIEVESLVGGFTTGDRSSASFSIDAGFVYRPIPALGIRIGYHLTVFDLNEDDGPEGFEWTGSVAGLYWGAQLSF